MAASENLFVTADSAPTTFGGSGGHREASAIAPLRGPLSSLFPLLAPLHPRGCNIPPTEMVHGEEDDYGGRGWALGIPGTT